MSLVEVNLITIVIYIVRRNFFCNCSPWINIIYILRIPYRNKLIPKIINNYVFYFFNADRAIISYLYNNPITTVMSIKLNFSRMIFICWIYP